MSLRGTRTTDSLLNRAFRVIGTAARVLTGKQMAGRNVTVFDDDIFITSYPRSGNTWTRFLVGNLMYPDDPVTFSTIESRIPEIYFNPDHVMRRLPRPRVLKSHESFQPNYPRVIYIVRDPRDVSVSFYYHNLKWRNIPDNYPMDAFVARFVRAEFDNGFGSRADNVGSWLSMREGSANFLLLRYEDLKLDPARQLEKVAAFLSRCCFRDIKSSPDRLARAVELSTPERMRSLETQESRNWVLTKYTRADLPFVRTAVVGKWRSALSEQAISVIEGAWKPWIQRLGYPMACEETRPQELKTHK